jgi:hypothetical protein
MHTHDRHSAETLPEPVDGEQPRFWDGDTQYTLKAEKGRWILHGHFQRGGAAPLGVVRRAGAGWSAGVIGQRDSIADVTLARALRFLM